MKNWLHNVKRRRTPHSTAQKKFEELTSLQRTVMRRLKENGEVVPVQLQWFKALNPLAACGLVEKVGRAYRLTEAGKKIMPKS